MYKITKEFAFCASHELKNLTAEHPCMRLHGHNYIVIFELQSDKLDEAGMLVDYHKLAVVKNFIDTKLDHRHLNDVMDVIPTAENIAKYLFDNFSQTFPELNGVIVKETPKTSATYFPYEMSGLLKPTER